MNLTRGKVIKVYLKEFEVEILDEMARVFKVSRSKLVSNMIRGQIKKDTK